MPQRASPSSADVLNVMRHLADVAALKGNPPAQRHLLIDELNQIVGTHSALLFVAESYAPGAQAHFSHCTVATQHDALFLRYVSEFGVKFPLEDDPYCYCSIRSAKTEQTWTSDTVLPDRQRQWRHPYFMDLQSSTRLRDGIVSFYRTGERRDRIVGVGMHRFGDSARLSRRQLAMVQFAMAEIRRLADRGHLMLPPAPRQHQLTPRLQQVLDRLLAGGVPKEIARELDLSIWTVREHVQRVYQHFGVCGREELMARFVR